MNEIQRGARESSGGIVREFVHFLSESKKWWLLPFIILFVLFGALMLLSSTAAAPFIYTLF
jgi:hypothetical protein